MTFLLGTAELLQILEDRFKFLDQQEGVRALLHLPHFLSFLRGEPRLAGCIQELQRKSAAAVKRLREHDFILTARMREIWSEFHADIVSSWASKPAEIRDSAISPEIFESGLNWSSEFVVLRPTAPFFDPTHSGPLLGILSVISNLPDSQMDQALKARIAALHATHQHEYRTFWIAGRTMAGIAYDRLVELAFWINPPPPPLDDPIRKIDYAFITPEMRPLIDAIYNSHRSSPTERSRTALTDAVLAVRQDSKLLLEEIKSLLATSASHLALVTRFAARCERYHAERLRSHAKGRQAEASLTREFASFLFDHGMNPLVDPKIAHLRPDVWDQNHGDPLYVEAKQYRGRNPRGQIIKAVRQVLDTHGRINRGTNVKEAFLLIFRVDGPIIDVPRMLITRAVKLHIVTVDIAAPVTVGSRQKHAPIRIEHDELLPHKVDA